MKSQLKRVYWETTASCNLRCIHCRRVDVLDDNSPDELSTMEAKRFISELTAFGRPVLIFSGGEPLRRPDILELAQHAHGLGLPVALSTNGTLVTAELAGQIKGAGIYYASISLDGANAATHDAFRGAGNFEKALRGMNYLQAAGIKVQINFTVTRKNAAEIDAIYELAREAKAIALYLFLLVPVGCGVQIAASDMLSAAEVETWLHWVQKKDRSGPLPIKSICAPHYFRVDHEETAPNTPPPEERKGCLAGIHMCFVSHKGDVFPCGYLPLSAGNVRKESLTTIWNTSPMLQTLRDSSQLSGRCGDCSYRDVCGGCRARAFYAYGDYLGEEPFCVHTPKKETSASCCAAS